MNQKKRRPRHAATRTGNSERMKNRTGPTRKTSQRKKQLQQGYARNKRTEPAIMQDCRKDRLEQSRSRHGCGDILHDGETVSIVLSYFIRSQISRLLSIVFFRPFVFD